MSTKTPEYLDLNDAWKELQSLSTHIVEDNCKDGAAYPIAEDYQNDHAR